MEIKDKVVAITGGSKGLGKSLAQIFKHDGAKVVILSRDGDEVQRVSDQMGVDGFVCDVTSEKQVNDVVEQIVQKYGAIDVWINNAGVWMPREDIDVLDVEKGKNLININLFGTINGLRAVLGVMKPNKSGMIVNIMSTTAFDGMNGSSGSMYVASKYALRGLTNVVRDELKDTGVVLLGVYPGGFKSEVFRHAVPKNFDTFMETDDVATKIFENIRSDAPLLEQIIPRLGQVLPDYLK